MEYIGIDIGSVSINMAVLDDKKRLKKVFPYTRHYGEPIKVIKEHFDELYTQIKAVNNIQVTGSGGKLLAKLLSVNFINELPAQVEAAHEFYPNARTIIDIGGEDSKFIDIEKEDYAMNELCAAGTGSFLDQQASRLGFLIEEFGDVALKSKIPSRIAGRCTVFAKTDMIHLQQEATPDYDILAGLCFALARNFKSEIAKCREFKPPILFLGGVALNKGMVKAFNETLNLNDNELIVPEYCTSMGAIGAALIAINVDNHLRKIEIQDCINASTRYLESYKVEWRVLSPLSISKSKLPSLNFIQSTNGDYDFKAHIGKKNGSEGVLPHPTPLKVDAFVGVDVGSISTNVVAIDRNKNLIEKVYLWAAGRPIEAVRQGIKILGDKVGKYINVIGAGTTGSGRYLTGDFIGADVVVNEITAQAKASVHIDPKVDTIFEIGGQDSKYISLADGVIVDFEMNKVCAAGTGSFLEEQAERVDIPIKDFGDIALGADRPCDLGERCTVFMETNLISYQRQGVNKENLVSGLCYSIVKNYLSQVVGKKRIGDKIFFQGAVAFNKGVVAAFEKVLGKPITVPPNHHVTGAIGAAIASMERTKSPTKFRGFDVIPYVNYTQQSFECTYCPNRCQVKKVVIGNSNPLYYGARCERYEIDKKKLKLKTLDLFAEREKFLLEAYKNFSNVSGPRVGIPYASIFHEFLPFWTTFLGELGFQVVLSNKTNKKIIHDGVGASIAEFCFPIKVVIGHVINLLEKEVDYLFLPSIIDIKAPKGMRRTYICPYNQEIPHIIISALRPKVKILHPIIFFRNERSMNKSLMRFGEELGKSKSQIKKAISSAKLAQEKFYDEVKHYGEEVMKVVDEKGAFAIIGRSYSTCDEATSLEIPKILRELGKLVIPMDFLPLESSDVLSDWPNIYWIYQYRILSAAKLIKNNPNLRAVYLTNFGCGPDSFIHQYFRKEMAKKPFLQIEIDEHSAPAGVMTRCEAFLDSIENARKIGIKEVKRVIPKYRRFSNRKVFLPHMGDCAYAPWAAFKRIGIPAEVIQSNDETLELGRKYTSGKECYPCVITTGDMIKTLKYNDPDKVAFFMSTAYGPCRFGQYCHLQRMVLDDLGYEDVPIVSPGAPESLDFYRQYDMANPSGILTLIRALQGVVAIDQLLKVRREKRPYEIYKGEVDKIYNKWLTRICESIQNGGVGMSLKNATQEFQQISIKDDHKPRIAIVGEIFVRSHEYSNNYIERKVENYGGEVVFPPFYEWGLHTSGTRKIDALVDGKPVLASLTRVIEFVLKYFERRFGRWGQGILKYPEEVKIEEIWGAASPYLIKWFGESALSIGDATLWVRKKEIDGVINLMPFTCMPGNITAAAFKRVKDDYGIPILDIAFDGLEQSTLETRLETFMYQANKRTKNDSRR